MMLSIDQKIDLILKRIGRDLKLNREAEHEILTEIRTHFEDIVFEAEERGESIDQALESAVVAFGLPEVGPALHQVHSDTNSIDPILICLIPVLATLVLRWLTFSPSGSAVDWSLWLRQPAFWIVALAALLIPILQFRERIHILISWVIFWALSIIFATLPVALSW